jgi:hypothetical protein
MEKQRGQVRLEGRDTEFKSELVSFVELLLKF